VALPSNSSGFAYRPQLEQGGANDPSNTAQFKKPIDLQAFETEPEHPIDMME
jgi:hypothetical protein